MIINELTIPEILDNAGKIPWGNKITGYYGSLEVW